MAYRTLGLAAFLLAGLCQAQTVYKVIGPDGKIAYTDRPPLASAQTAVTTLGRPAPPSEAVNKAATARAVEASLQVYYKQIIVHSAKRLCGNFAGEASPGAKDAASEATRAALAWEQRHAALTQKKILVVQDALQPSELLAIANHAERENEAILQKLRNASPAERVAWCRRMPKTLAAPEFDLAGNAVLVRAVMDYLPRK